ncbi:MAG: hypothetical protein C4332_04860 [Meiothermus sp.]
MNTDPDNHSRNQIIGIILVVLGGLFLLGQVVDLGESIGHWGWPFFVMLPGILLLVLAFVGGKTSAGLAVPGSIVTTVGLILFVQNVTDHFESWAYAWGLLVAAAGVGRFLQGTLEPNLKTRQQGLQLASAGVILFVAFAAFFELFIFNQSQLAHHLVPIALIAVGAYLLMRRNASERGSEPPRGPSNPSRPE